MIITERTHPERNTPFLWVVEDDPTEVTLIRHVLAKMPDTLYDVRVFGRGAEALTAMSDASPLPSAMLVDLHLPDGTGDRLVRQVRRHPRGKSLALAALSSSDDWESIEQMYEAGVNTYLIKPVDIAVFARILSGALRFLDRLPGRTGGRSPDAENETADT